MSPCPYRRFRPVTAKRPTSRGFFKVRRARGGVKAVPAASGSGRTPESQEWRRWKESAPTPPPRDSTPPGGRPTPGPGRARRPSARCSSGRALAHGGAGSRGRPGAGAPSPPPRPLHLRHDQVFRRHHGQLQTQDRHPLPTLEFSRAEGSLAASSTTEITRPKNASSVPPSCPARLREPRR